MPTKEHLFVEQLRMTAFQANRNSILRKYANFVLILFQQVP